MSEERFKFDDKKHVYTLDGKRMYGITEVLSVIAKPALLGWASKMAIEYIADNIHLLIGADPETREQILNEAKNAHRRKKEDAAQRGTDVHTLVESWVTSQILGVLSDTDYTPIKKFIKWAERENVRFLEAEKRLYSKEHWIAGTCDLVFEKDGKTYIGDIKTYKKLWDRTPMLQCAGYGLMHKEMYGTDIAGYCIIRIKDDDFETRWSYDVEGDREGFLAAVRLYKSLKNWI